MPKLAHMNNESGSGDALETLSLSRREMLKRSATLFGTAVVAGIGGEPLLGAVKACTAGEAPAGDAESQAIPTARATPETARGTAFPPLFAKSDWDRQGRWAASWIACPDAGAPPVVTAFRLGFKCSAETVRIRVSADERYELFLDGHRVGRGSERGNLEHWFYESYDLALAAGDHVLAARVWSLGADAPLAQFSVRPEFLLAAEGKVAGLLDTGLAPWEAKRLPGYAIEPPEYPWGLVAPETVDGVSFAWDFEFGHGEGWRRAEAGAPAWSGLMDYGIAPDRLLQNGTLPPQHERPWNRGTVRLTAAVDTLETAPIAVRAADHLPAESEAWQHLVCGRAPLTLPPRTRRRVIVDLDDYVCAYPEIEVSGGAGSLVRILWAESLRKKPGKWDFDKGNRDAVEGKYFLGMGATFRPDGGRSRRFGTLWWSAGRYLEITVQTAADPLVLDSFVLSETRYPLEMESAFSSSDPEFDANTPLLVRGEQMCAHETYVDCPYFEQMQYVGDARIEARTQYVMSRDDRLSRKALYMIAASRHASGLTEARYPVREPQFIPWFSLLWVGMVHDYACWRDDAGFVQSLLPAVRGIIEAFLAARDPRGRVRTPEGWNFEGTKDGELSGMVHWLFVWTLQLAAELEEGFGDAGLADRARRHRADLAQIADSAFWDEARGLYANDPERTQYDELVQSFALLSRAVPAAKQPIVEGQLRRGGQAHWSTVDGLFYLFELCRIRGLTDLFFQRMTLWSDQRRQGFKTPVESWDKSSNCALQFAGSRSDCHGWGSYPLPHYFTTVLGIQPAAWGFRRVEIRPQPGPLTWASGRLVHPAGGEIVVELRRAADAIHGRVVLPANLAGTLVLQGGTRSLEAGETIF